MTMSSHDAAENVAEAQTMNCAWIGSQQSAALVVLVHGFG